MTKQQYIIGKAKTSPASLENVLIENCLEELKNNKETQKSFNAVTLEKIDDIGYISFSEFNSIKICICDLLSEDPLDFEFGLTPFLKLNKIYQKELTFNFLSRTPDGQAVMEFLDVELDKDELAGYLEDKDYPPFYLISNNLLEILSLLFNWFLAHGKTFEESYKTINLIYLQYV
jgi:hypothetical protein